MRTLILILLLSTAACSTVKELGKSENQPSIEDPNIYGYIFTPGYWEWDGFKQHWVWGRWVPDVNQAR
jgi:hypothetical protein